MQPVAPARPIDCGNSGTGMRLMAGLLAALPFSCRLFGDPEVGRMALEESRAAISELLAEARLLVMVVGLGGGTGSGVAPLLAEMAAEERMRH